jgi:hypothetical protein
MKLSGSVILLALLIGGCGRPGQGDDPAPGNQAAAMDDRVLCALHGADSYEPDCTVEISQTPAGELYVVREPDGGFRRLIRTGNEQLFAAADGAEPATAKVRDGRFIEVAIGNDHYLFKNAQEAVPAKGSR